MRRGSDRRHNRSHRSRERGDTEDERLRRVRELERELEERDRRLAEYGQFFQQPVNNYQADVERGYDNYSPAETEEMSPIRVGRSRSSSSSEITCTGHFIRQPQFASNEPAPVSYPYEPPPNIRYENPPDYQRNGSQLRPFYNEGPVDVRIEGMPRWPMPGSPESHDERPERVPASSLVMRPQSIQVEPIPVYPIEGENKTMKQKEYNQKIVVQLAMIQQQAELAAMAPKGDRSLEVPDRRKDNKQRDGRRDHSRKERRASPSKDRRASPARDSKRSRSSEKRAEERRVRHDVQRLRQESLKKMDQKRREAERKERIRKEEKEEARKREERRKEDELAMKSRTDELFLQYLLPAFGKIECNSTRIEGKNPVEYTSKCVAVNIPKEFFYGSKIADTKGDSYKGAITNFVDKLTSLGVIDSKCRQVLWKLEKLPKFLAEMIEPLCDDIAIYGYQLSVSNQRDPRSAFESFAKEKSSEFWEKRENSTKLNEFLRRYDRKRNPTRSRSRSQERKRNGGSGRRRSRSRDRSRGTPSPSNKKSLEEFFASSGTVSSVGNSTSFTNAPSFIPPSVLSSNNYMQPQLQSPILPSYNQSMSYAPQPPMNNQMMNPYMQSSYGASTSNGYGFQQPMMQQFPPQRPAFVPSNASNRIEDADLLDEIFT